MKPVQKSAKLANVCYDIRGPIMDRARQMEEEGHKIIKLNIGNLAVFGFDAPEEIQQDMIRNLPNSAGYSDSKGIFAARKAVMHETQKQGIKGVTLDDIYLGNGASELIVMATNALLDNGDELLLPALDYPLWTAAASLSGGTPVHYLCQESNGWMPDLSDIRARITPRTKGIVVINPNNPTGALSAPTRKVLRSMPLTFLPYMILFLTTPNMWHIFSSVSAISSKGSSSLALKSSWDFMLSRETPNTVAPALTKSLYLSRNCMASVVQPGVLSFG